jgi:hypothetical protein
MLASGKVCRLLKSDARLEGLRILRERKIQNFSAKGGKIILITSTRLRFLNLDQGGEPKMKSIQPQVLYVTAIIILVCLLFWVAALFIGYLADDWNSPAADERSIPAPRTY